jgi:hypothetical protein
MREACGHSIGQFAHAQRAMHEHGARARDELGQQLDRVRANVDGRVRGAKRVAARRRRRA